MRPNQKPYRDRKPFRMKKGGGRYLLSGDHRTSRASAGANIPIGEFLKMFMGPMALMNFINSKGRRKEGQGR